MRALNDGGVLSVTLWNKEEPPKSVLKLYATMAEAARDARRRRHRQPLLRRRRAISRPRPCSTSAAASPPTRSPSCASTRAPCRSTRSTLPASTTTQHRRRRSSTTTGTRFSSTASADPTRRAHGRAAARHERARRRRRTGRRPARTQRGAGDHHGPAGLAPPGPRRLGRDRGRYVFDTRLLTNDRPYFAAYVKPGDLPRVTDRLELFQDEWGYLLLWATLAIACIAALSLVLIPVIFGWRTIFSRYPGKFRTIVYFACLGARLHHGRGRPDRRLHAGARATRPCRPRC